MSFAHPIAFCWGLLAIPIVLLYLRRTRMRRAVVATDWIWRQALVEDGRRAAWQPWREHVSLALQLVVLGLIVVALAGPQFGDGAGLAMPTPSAILAAAVLAIVAVEWALYQRRWLS